MLKSTYSVHVVPSPLFNGTVQLNDKLTSLLLTWADTTPRVRDVALGSPRYAYSQAGKKREAAVAMTVFMESGGKAYWDLVRKQLDDEDEASPLSVKRSHAAIEAVPFSVYSKDSFLANRIELKNRQTMQRVLWLGTDLDTQALEAQLLLTVVEAPRTLNELAAATQQPLLTTQLACLRLYRRGLVSLPVADEFLSGSWLVTRAQP